MKSHPTFAAVLAVLCQCKDEVSSRLYRYWHWDRLQGPAGTRPVLHCQHTPGTAAWGVVEGKRGAMTLLGSAP